MPLIKCLRSDPRHIQILSLAAFFIVLYIWSDFGPTIEIFVLTCIAALTSQAFFHFIFIKEQQFEWRSAVITSFSLSLLLKASSLYLFPIAAFLAIASKFLLRLPGKHIFNPANIAIVALLLITPDLVWISPGQWGQEIWFSLLIIGLASILLSSFSKNDMALLFLGFYSCFLFMRAFWLGDPISIPLHQIQQGALLLFTFFMISDPKTTPNDFRGRVLFAFAVALLGFFMQFNLQIREGIFYALAAICLLRPLLDKIWSGDYFNWRTK